MAPPTITICGNIGAGKSTLFEGVLKRYMTECRTRRGNLPFRLHRLDEPCEEWLAEGTLDRFYQAQARAKPNERVAEAMGFQIRILQTQVQAYERLLGSLPPRIGDSLDFQSAFPKRDIIFSERSPQDGLMVFVKAQHACGQLCDTDAQALIWFYRRMAWQPSHYIFVRSDPEVCYSRVQSRNRVEESDMSLQYLETLHNYYEQFYSQVMCRHPVLVLDNGEGTDMGALTQQAWDWVSAV